MFKAKPLFITFEGIEGSGKSYQIKKLFNNLKKKKIFPILTREPGGTKSAEKIRNLILEDYFHESSYDKFNKYTDTLLYLASRNEHVEKKILPSLSKNTFWAPLNTVLNKVSVFTSLPLFNCEISEYSL